MVIDLFDVIDMIDIVLDDIGYVNEVQSLFVDVIVILNKIFKEILLSFIFNIIGILILELIKSFVIFLVFGGVMIGVVCFSFVLFIW